ncbi:hypothetical protein M427DRAFT_396151 [Gonapodya prolifera JEL478]|uniref:Uncharacterized protein n=1 Tax=Gonapodya prolifera (strain JEL478) TaxID=1344416 RepID=A0A139A7B5_GONPJ|nr:hypothetical protein M427DRAFT_396151 [Gonapodya prolifera JEL478]|eukprot:KXS12569.1 hypothetical protein M427DRAFT_396151 [Gonapodya prolifera JEL478]
MPFMSATAARTSGGGVTFETPCHRFRSERRTLLSSSIAPADLNRWRRVAHQNHLDSQFKCNRFANSLDLLSGILLFTPLEAHCVKKLTWIKALPFALFEMRKQGLELMNNRGFLRCFRFTGSELISTAPKAGIMEPSLALRVRIKPAQELTGHALVEECGGSKLRQDSFTEVTFKQRANK